MLKYLCVPTYTAHGHNLNFYVGLLKSFFCPPTLIRKVKFIPAPSITQMALHHLRPTDGQEEYFAHPTLAENVKIFMRTYLTQMALHHLRPTDGQEEYFAHPTLAKPDRFLKPVRFFGSYFSEHL